MGRFEIRVGDLARSEADAIVNATDECFSGGGGVDAAIHRAAGPELTQACRALDACGPGEVRLTPGFALPARWILHTVGPRWQGGTAGEAAVLAQCYRACLKLAAERQWARLDFCSISTDVFAYPLPLAATVAEKAIMEFLLEHPFPETVGMVCRTEQTAAVYRQVYNLWFASEKAERL